METPNGRELTTREREVLVAMITHAKPSHGSFDEGERAALLEKVDDLRVWGRCACGHCPSIDLGDSSGEYASVGPRVILDGWRGTEGLILFIDQGRPTYLEQYSGTDDVFEEFAPVDEIEFS
ncbi:hypothetical protein [Microbacterium galbinum]|uniref:Uncharacterized protein n=1 Tax=Microbacterium galbinum TaxID=2851646 RepID=A0ABY4IQH1_9MICO|nr:hypothetical protein [Microbacterium galbinum]UPL14500.1 hypothetical protein KV396_08435 [Microbacterium galbinum]